MGVVGSKGTSESRTGGESLLMVSFTFNGLNAVAAIVSVVDVALAVTGDFLNGANFSSTAALTELLLASIIVSTPFKSNDTVYSSSSKMMSWERELGELNDKLKREKEPLVTKERYTSSSES